MTLKELEEAKAAAVSREDFLKTISNVRDAGFSDGFITLGREKPDPQAFGIRLDERAVEALREALIVTLNSRVAAIEFRLRKLGVVIEGDPLPGAHAAGPIGRAGRAAQRAA
ncbi:hypothetical protein [Methylobacterium sp. SD21]|uniref:hypothetical protein n=1 Tax=Methylobacterium litchii TaxID=3138810 RepID=UPI00313BC3D2